uniref:Uncharacterized protein n=1 Tax=Labrus bergylta TaxID=56723 RepID=A0A3Q3G2F2_9LABR
VQSVWIPGVKTVCSMILFICAVGRGEAREKRSLPYWGLWSSDFLGWLEELRARAADAGVQDLARTFWAHFPIANELGYDSPDPDPQTEE